VDTLVLLLTLEEMISVLFIMMLAISLSHIDFIVLMYVLSIPSFFRPVIMKKCWIWLVLVAHAYNPNYLEVGYWEDCSLRLTWANGF
jgi:hypothetical protein